MAQSWYGSVVMGGLWSPISNECGVLARAHEVCVLFGADLTLFLRSFTSYVLRFPFRISFARVS